MFLRVAALEGAPAGPPLYGGGMPAGFYISSLASTISTPSLLDALARILPSIGHPKLKNAHSTERTQPMADYFQAGQSQQSR